MSIQKGRGFRATHSHTLSLSIYTHSWCTHEETRKHTQWTHDSMVYRLWFGVSIFEVIVWVNFAPLFSFWGSGGGHPKIEFFSVDSFVPIGYYYTQASVFDPLWTVKCLWILMLSINHLNLNHFISCSLTHSNIQPAKMDTLCLKLGQFPGVLDLEWACFRFHMMCIIHLHIRMHYTFAYKDALYICT